MIQEVVVVVVVYQALEDTLLDVTLFPMFGRGGANKTN